MKGLRELQSFPVYVSRARDCVLSEIGIRLEDVRNFSSFSRLLHSPRDPSGLSVIRVLFGVLMFVDVHHERGLSMADERWGRPHECRFPLMSFLRPLPLQWMIVLYLVMLFGAVGITLGYRYRLSCLCFVVPYWYIFLLDKSHWNNHSYLFGLIATQMTFFDAHRCWSVDGKRQPDIRHTHVPLWNYALLRGQIFLVYFIAGLKKTNLDWIEGYSMEKLGYHWVFDGFRFFLTGDQITYLVVHLGGFFLDLTVGFFMLMKFSRPYAFFFCAMFNLMNSRMFAIGMFPYVMIAVMPIFCEADWPKHFIKKIPLLRRNLSNSIPGRNPDCIYPGNEPGSIGSTPSKRKEKLAALRHRFTAGVFLCYFALQGFLPYSHWLTKGYNTWTQGLYGYSWDMMVHNWRFVHTTITVAEKKTGRVFHLDPDFWAASHRWTHHADMVKQLAHCVEKEMAEKYRLRDIAVYIDVWTSLNRRFIQRMYDPTVDVLSAEWSPFKEVPWVLPLQSELSGWRMKLMEMEEHYFHQSEDLEVAFLADFPGFNLLNYMGSDFENSTLQVLKGSVEIQIPPNQTVTLNDGEQILVPISQYHLVSPLKQQPACYMYIYYVKHKTNATEQGTDQDQDFWKGAVCPVHTARKQIVYNGNDFRPILCWEKWKRDLAKKMGILSKSVILIAQALHSILTNNPMVVGDKAEKREL